MDEDETLSLPEMGEYDQVYINIPVSLIKLVTCGGCGAMVSDTATHNKFHAHVKARGL